MEIPRSRTHYHRNIENIPLQLLIFNSLVASQRELFLRSAVSVRLNLLAV
jgi:hypothetical protein